MDQFWYVLPLTAWAVIGWVARMMNSDWLGWKSSFASLVTSVAAAAIVGLLLDGAGLSENVLCGISGGIGWTGGKIMEDIIKWSRRRAEKIIAGEDPRDGEED